MVHKNTPYINGAPVSTSNPLPSTMQASEVVLGKVAGDATTITLTPTISTTAYTAKDGIGGKLTLANAVRVPGGVSILQSLLVVDKANQKAALTILLFDSDPSGSTLTNDAEPTIVAADIAKVIRKIDIAAADYATIAHAGTDFAVAELTALSKVVKAASGTSLYALVTTSGTPDYVADGDLILRFGFLYAN